MRCAARWSVALPAGLVHGLFGFAGFFVTLRVVLARADAGPAHAAAWGAALAMALLL
jgi:hypothetical protein